jgi:hypothetical protein
VDAAVQFAETRRKKILIADMDSTMIGQECIDELAAEVGLKDKVSAITARAMNGEIAFEPALRERVALLKGLPVDVIDEGDRQPHHADTRADASWSAPCAPMAAIRRWSRAGSPRSHRSSAG